MAAKKKHPATKEADRTIKTLTPADLPQYYANRAEIRRSQVDFDLRFSQVLTATDEELVVQEVAHVYMSPQHAKSLLGLLKGQVEAYEEQHGELKSII